MAGELNLKISLIRDALNAIHINPQPQLMYALLEATVAGTPITNTQMPLNLCLVLDRSGSMSGDKIKNLRDAVHALIDLLQPTDYLSIVLFDDQVETPVASQPATNPAQLHAIVSAIQERGGTQISLGLRQGLAEIARHADPNHISKIVMLTDGNSWGDEAECLALAQQAAQNNAPIIALGLGLPQAIAAPGLPLLGGAMDDWNHLLLDNLARASDGASDLIDAPSKIAQVFQAVVKTAHATVIRNAELVLRLPAEVTPRQVWQVSPLIQNLTARALSAREAQVTLGDIDKQTGKAVLVELALPPKPAGKMRIAQAQVTYTVPAAPNPTEPQSERVDVIVEYGVESPLNPHVANVIERLSAHKLQTRALQDAAAGNVNGATQKLKQAATQLLNLGEADLAHAALQEAQNLAQQGKMSAAGTKRLNYGTRKLTVSL